MNDKVIKVLARIASVVFHPLNAPTLGLVFIFTSGTFISLLPFEAKKLITLVVFINTLVLPLIMIPLFQRLGIIKSIHMADHRERLVPIVFTLIPYAFSFYFLRKLPIPGVVPIYMLAASITLIFTLIITIWWKISIHMIGMGGITGLIFAFAINFHIDALALQIMAILFSGIVAWARLSLKAHSPWQVYSGFILGCLIMVSIMLLL
jgi:hypothetical protein